MLIIFDFDGTLFFETAKINYYSINKALEEFHKPSVSFERANATVGDTVYKMCENLIESTDEKIVTAYYESLMKHTIDAIKQMAKIEPDAILMLKVLKEKGCKLSICSNAEKIYLDTLLKLFDIRKYFDHVWSFKKGFKKVDGIAHIKSLFNEEKAVMVGDRNEDVLSGKANSCITIAIKNDFGDSDVENADYLVYNHEQMLERLFSLI